LRRQFIFQQSPVHYGLQPIAIGKMVSDKPTADLT